MVNEIYIIDDDSSSVEVFKELFRDETDYEFISVKTEEIDMALQNIPLLIVINEDSINIDIIEICKKIRKDEDNTITPVIVVSSNRTRKHRMKILNESIEYFIKKPVDEGYLYYTIKNLTRLVKTNRRMSALTGLPGNVQIQAELKKHLARKENFSVLYLDLDNFKAYNDVYGFLKGDSIIQFTADVIIESIRECSMQGFVGHVGGDDFIAIVQDVNNVEKLCQHIIARFDKQVKKFFNDEDIERGYIEIANRRGIIEQFPLTSISIAVVVAENGRFVNVLEIGDIAAQVKHKVKNIIGSSYIINKRKK